MAANGNPGVIVPVHVFDHLHYNYLHEPHLPLQIIDVVVKDRVPNIESFECYVMLKQYSLDPKAIPLTTPLHEQFQRDVIALDNTKGWCFNIGFRVGPQYREVRYKILEGIALYLLKIGQTKEGTNGFHRAFMDSYVEAMTASIDAPPPEYVAIGQHKLLASGCGYI